MRYLNLGKTDIKASVVALGTWAVGGWMWGGTEEKFALLGIEAAIDSGINFIDTAPVYGFGISEKIVARAIKGKRDKIILATKCGLIWDDNKGEYFFSTKFAGDNIRIYKYLGKESIRKEVEQSLKRLDTDYIDLYQTHWQNKATPIEDVMEELIKLKEEGKIRSIGVSNINVEGIKKYELAGIVDSDQEKYSIIDRKLESSNLAYCDKNNISFLAYSPLANGLLTGKISPEREFTKEDLRFSNPRFSKENRFEILKKLKILDPLVEKYNANYAQLILAWTLHQKGCTHVLAGARNEKQAFENAKAGDIEFSKEDLKIFKIAFF